MRDLAPTKDTPTLDFSNSTAHNSMLGPMYWYADAARKLGNFGLQQLLIANRMVLDTSSAMGAPDFLTEMPKSHNRALMKMSEFAMDDFAKPAFGLDKTVIDGNEVAVSEEIIDGCDLPFGRLLHFKREVEGRNDPPVLIVAPMSGHNATLLRDTVKALLPDQDVYITDWGNAADVPLSEGKFGLDDYIAYLEDFIKKIGPDVNIVAVCQSTVPVLAAVSHLAETDPSSQPRTMTLMGGPLDTEAAPTVVTKFAKKHPIEWFQKTVVSKAANGRLVYSGNQQVASFMGMNMSNHIQKFTDIYNDLRKGNDDKAQRGLDFYQEYFSSSDMDGKFYLETVSKIFQENQLAKGNFYYGDHRVDPSKITRTAVYTVEGENDDISAPGQTIAVHNWMTGVSPDRHRRSLVPGIGHYGLFSGSTWREKIAPSIAGFIRDTAAKDGREYSPASVVTDSYK
ncbi:MAG: polyhydroxyalkanoate depolymerase [Candidatus Saccharimonadales bacterium]